MHKCLYEDIEKLEVVAKKKYMSIGSPLAYEAYVSDFKFTFKNGQTFYFYWPMILNDDFSELIEIFVPLDPYETDRN